LKKRKGACGERQILQYHYTSWPDHGVPAHPLPVLSFVRKSSALAEAGNGPVVVHCSAGVGRTGTYIAVDAILKQIRTSEEFNVFGLLRHIRKQRNYLVQTEEQYVFIHDALVEAVRSGNTEIPCASVGREIERLCAENASKGIQGEIVHHTPLDRQFDVIDHGHVLFSIMISHDLQLITSYTPSDFNYMSAKKACNLTKCRDPSLVPIESHRVCLCIQPGVEGSDFINATWLHGYT